MIKGLKEQTRAWPCHGCLGYRLALCSFMTPAESIVRWYLKEMTGKLSKSTNINEEILEL